MNHISLTYPSASSSNPFLPVTVSLGVVVLLLITCVALLVIPLAVTATKLKRLRAEKCHTDPRQYYNQTAIEEGKTIERIYDEVGEGTVPVERQKGQYQELNLETMEKRQYACLHGEVHQC